MKKKIAVVLSGCGNKDGSEITETVSLIIGLSQHKAQVSFFCPGLEIPALDFLSNQLLNTSRNIRIESARITRSQMQDLKDLDVNQFDGLAFPGGLGAAKNLSNWANAGHRCELNIHVQRAIQGFYQQKKPIAAICIAPVLLARSLGQHKITVTVGDDQSTITEILKTGADHEECPVDDFISDRDHKIITTPAYMYGEATPFQIFTGINKLCGEFMEMA